MEQVVDQRLGSTTVEMDKRKETRRGRMSGHIGRLLPLWEIRIRALTRQNRQTDKIHLQTEKHVCEPVSHNHPPGE